MKILSVLALCLISLILSFTVPFPGRAAEEQPALLKRELVKLEMQSWEAWKNHDGKFFERFLSNDHVELGFGGLTTKASIVAGVASGVCQVRDYTLKNFELRMLGNDTALLTYYEAQETNCQGTTVPSPCWVSSLYMKREGRWLNVLYQQTQSAK